MTQDEVSTSVTQSGVSQTLHQEASATDAEMVSMCQEDQVLVTQYGMYCTLHHKYDTFFLADAITEVSM